MLNQVQMMDCKALQNYQTLSFCGGLKGDQVLELLSFV